MAKWRIANGEWWEGLFTIYYLLSTGPGQRVDPTSHPGFRVLNIFVAEEFFEVDSIDRIDRAHKVVLVAEGNGGVDAHAALKRSVGGGPLLLPGRHSLGRHEGLAASAWERVDDVGFWIHAGCETPHHVVHVIRIGAMKLRCQPSSILLRFLT